VVVGEPPFLAQADIPAWLKQLDLLASKEFRGYTVLAGRGGKTTVTDLNAMRRFLKDVEARLKPLARKKSAPAEIDKLAARLAGKFKGSGKRQLLYTQRLRFGMQAYFTRRYLPATKSSNND